jgi:hypothetical protein
MLKNILKLKGVQKLNVNEQKVINGGIHRCASEGCPTGYFCCIVGCKTAPCFE